MSFDIYTEFSGDTESSGSHPYCQIINPPNNKPADLKNWLKSNKFGLFIPQEQAEAAGFQPDARWEETSVALGDSEDRTPGYITLNPRFTVIRKSGLECQEKVGTRWQYRGPAYVKGQMTRWMEQVKADAANSDRSWRSVVRYLFAFVGEDNQVLSEVPIQFSAKGAVGAALGAEIRDYAENIGKIYAHLAKEKGIKGVKPRLNDFAMAFAAIDMKMDYIRPDASKSPYVVPTQRLAAAYGQYIGASKEVDRGGHPVVLVGTDLESLLMSKNSEPGKIIGQWYSDYEDFEVPGKSDNGPEDVTLIGDFDYAAAQYDADGSAVIPFNSDGMTYICTIPSTVDQETIMVAGEKTVQGKLFNGALTAASIQSTKLAF